MKQQGNTCVHETPRGGLEFGSGMPLGRLKLRHSLIVFVSVSLFAASLSTSLQTLSESPVSAHDQTETYRVRVPPYTKEIPLFNYEYQTSPVRVAPFTQTVEAYHYREETKRVRVPPFTRRVATYNYSIQTSRVRVPPYTTSRAVYNYELQSKRVRIAPYTKVVAAYNYASRKTCHPLYGCSTSRVRVAPFTRRVAAYNYRSETQRVRVAPFSERVEVFHYSEQRKRVRVAPYFRIETVYNYEDKKTRVRVPPYTTTEPVYNYEQRTSRVRVAPFAGKIEVFNYETRTRPVEHIHPTTTTTTLIPSTTTSPTTTLPPPTTTNRQATSRPTSVTGLRCTSSTTNSLTATWNAVQGANEYLLSTRLPPSGATRLGNAGRGAATSDSITQLKGGYTYSLTVRAYNDNGGSISVSVSCKTVGEEWLTLSCSNSGALSARWSDPSGVGTSPSGYFVSFLESGSNVVHTLTAEDTFASKQVNLGRQYQVLLRTKNGNGGPVYSQSKTHTCTAQPTATTTVPRTLPTPTNFEAVCRDEGMELTWAVIPSAQVLSPLRKFNVEIDGKIKEVVDYPHGSASISYLWQESKAGATYNVRIQELSKETTDPDHVYHDRWMASPWTTRKTISCPLFTPEKFEATCNNFGVVSTSWKALNRVSLYRIRGLPTDKNGSTQALIRNPNTSTSRQGEEGQTYTLRLIAQHLKGWSHPLSKTVTCPRVEFPHIDWILHKEYQYITTPQLDKYELINHVCETRYPPSGGTDRTCTTTWSENIKLVVDNRPLWKRLPLTSWSTPGEILTNISTILALIVSIRGLKKPGFESINSKISIAVAAGAQAAVAVEVASDLAHVYVKAYSRDASYVACLPDYYNQRSARLLLNRIRTGNHENEHVAIIYYCTDGIN